MKEEKKSLFPYYLNVPLSIDQSRKEEIIEWTSVKIHDKEEERDIIDTAMNFLYRHNIKLY
tara:strand:+ start:190 stop:372 length:183 start_codon:yes stop_codon:yes gene_type:complete